jgi:hypothetical protein
MRLTRSSLLHSIFRPASVPVYPPPVRQLIRMYGHFHRPSPASFLFRHGAPSTDRERRIISGFESLFSERLRRDDSSWELSLAVFDYGNY